MGQHDPATQRVIDEAKKLPRAKQLEVRAALEERAEPADEFSVESEAWLDIARENFQAGKAQIERGEYREGPITDLFDTLDTRLGLSRRS